MAKPALSSRADRRKANQTFKNPARAAARGNSTGGGTTTPAGPGSYINDLTPEIPGQVRQIFDRTSDIDTRAGQIGDQAIRYGQNNPFSNMAQGFNQDMLDGNMRRNKWEQDAYNDVSGISNPLQSVIDELMGRYTGQVGGGSNPGTGGGANYSASMSANPSLWGGGVGQSGGIRDTIGGSSDWVAQQIRALADPRNFDPANNPTLGPLMAKLRAEAGENQNAMMQDLAMQSEGSGLFGTGGHDYAMTRAREEGMESLDQQIAQILYGDYNAAQGRLMEGINMGNTRDMASMQDATQRYGIDSSAASAGAGIAAQQADAREARSLQALGMLGGMGQDLLGFKGSMANMRQDGQLGALNAGLGYGQLGMQGFNTGLAAQQNQLAALGLKGDAAQGISNAYLQDQANKNNLRLGLGQIGVARQGNNLQRLGMLNDSQMNLMNMLSQLASMGGTNTQTNPGQIIPGGPPSWVSGLTAGLGTGLNMYQNGMFSGQNATTPAPAVMPPGYIA